MLLQSEGSQMSNNFGFRPSLSEQLRVELLSVGFDSDLCVNIKREWSSENEDYRLKIRESLYADISQKCDVSKREFEDLSRIPEHSDFHISISHCRTFGGYTYVPKPHIIGFDVECLHRVTSKIVNRISNPKDNYDTVVNPAFVWVAKEAAFKAIQYVTPVKVIQEVIIQSWSMKSENVFEFQIANLMECNKLISFNYMHLDNAQAQFDEEYSKGCVIFDGDSAFAFYLLNLNKKGGAS